MRSVPKASRKPKGSPDKKAAEPTPTDSEDIAAGTPDVQRPPFAVLDGAPSLIDLQAFAGLYEADLPVGTQRPPSGGVGVMPIELRDGALVILDPRGYEFGLEPVGTDTFRLVHPGIPHEVTAHFARRDGIPQSVRFFDPTTDPPMEAPQQRVPAADLQDLARLTGSYRSPDLLNDLPVRLELNGGQLEMVWGIDEQRRPIHLLEDGRLTTHSPGMQCQLIVDRDDAGRAQGFRYEGHRVWGLPFERIVD